MQSSNIDLWFPYRKPKTKPGIRLICLPYAGGSAQIYQTWQKDLPQHVEVCAVELPGRWGRLRERPFQSIQKLVDAFSVVLEDLSDIPSAFFGYSFGALGAFELSRWLRFKKNRSPAHLFVAACRAPTMIRNDNARYLSDTALIGYISEKYGALPDALISDPEMREVVARIMRADITCLETYTVQEQPPLSCPITALGGEQDRSIKPNDLDFWRDQTVGEFKTQLFPGDHFFINDQRDAIIRVVSEALLSF